MNLQATPMQGLIAKKVGMSRVFLESGEAVPVTYLKVEPNTVVRCKTEDKDGHNAVVLGTGETKWKTRKGKEHTKYAVQKEWQVESTDGLTPGTQVTSELVPAESTVTITGVSKGKGFQGVIKRHKFAQGPKTHGSHHHRRPGSVGMCEFPGRILKGKKMPGRMGTDQVTLHKKLVVFTDPEQGLLGIKGPVPGPNGATVFVTFEFEADLSALQSDAAPTKDSEDTEEAKESEDTAKEEVKEEKKEEAKKDDEDNEDNEDKQSSLESSDSSDASESSDDKDDKEPTPEAA